MKVWKRILSFFLVVGLLFSLPTYPIKAEAATSASNIQVQMKDSYGDGWNGNKVEIYVDGAYSTGCTFSSGSSSTTTVSYDPGKSYEFKWYKGNYSSECSFSIVVDGQTVYSATTTLCSNFTSGQSLYVIEGSDYDLEGEFAGGSGITTDPYLVATKEQLDNVRNYPAAHFRQVRNIAFTSSDFASSGTFYNGGYGWEPIGTNSNPFYGTYNGNGHVISGLTITGSKTEYVGLFGCFHGSVVNLELRNLSYTLTGTNSSYVGGIAGGGYNSEFVGCTVSGQIQVVGNYVGGIAGDAYIAKHCTSTVAITVTDISYGDVGGIVGYGYKLIGCTNNGNISVSDGQANVGGIAGYAVTLASYCKNTGSVTAQTSEEYATINAGGIAGEANGSVTKCENTGVIRGIGYWDDVGGIIGCYSGNSGSITQCVNKAAIYAAVASGTNVIYYGYAGGIVGETNGGRIENCYSTSGWSPTSRGISGAYAGGIVGYVSDGTVTSCYSVISSVAVNTSASGWGRGGIAGINFGTITNSYHYYAYGIGYNSGSGSVSHVSPLSNFANSSTYYNFDFTSTWKMGTGNYTYAVLRMEDGHTHSLTHYAATVTYESSGKLEYWYCSSCETQFSNAAGTLYTTDDLLASDPLPRTGTCGTDVNWQLTYEGVLTISGKGAMANYTSQNAPWYECRDKVKKVVVQEGITGIGNYAFQDCTNLSVVKLPESITAIGNYAFSGCSTIANLVLPAHVTTVGDGAFSQITKLFLCFTGAAPNFAGSNMFLNTTVTAYYLVHEENWTETKLQNYGGTTVWTGIAALEDAIIASGSISYDKNWTLSAVGTLTITGDWSVDMPDYSYSTKPVWETYKDQVISLVLRNIDRVGNYNFDGYTSLEKADLGDACEIGHSAFEDCTALKKVYVSPSYFSSSTSNIIEDYAFYGCSALEEAAFSGYTSIGSYAFGCCSALTDIYIADCGLSNTAITNYLKPSTDSFYGVTATLHIPGNWTFYTTNNYGGNLTWEFSDFGPCGADAYWFYDASTTTITISGTGELVRLSAGNQYPWYSLYTTAKHLVIEDGISAFSAYTFEYMDSLQTVKLPSTLQQLSCNAFNDCHNLNNLIIPATITGFASGYYFNRCHALTDIYYMGTAEEWKNVANNSVVHGHSAFERLHFLTLHDGTATCTESGTQSYYTFDDTSVYSDMFDLQKNVITTLETIPASGHSIVTHEAQAPTCTEIGWDAYETCENCDHSTYKEIPANGHSTVNHDAKAPSCTEVGWKAYEDCNNCDLSTYEEIPATGHTLVNHNPKEPSCSEVGWGAYDTCENCDYSTYEEIPTINHSVVPHEAKAPTCTEIGWDAYVTCNNCDHSTYKEIPANGHSTINHDAKAPTCTENGWKAYESCENCDYSTYEGILATDHTIVNHDAKEPTCTEIGWYAYQTCKNCDNSTYIERPATGHNTVKHDAKAPTCTEIGWDAYETCENCDHSTYKEIPANGHSTVNHDAKAPSCTEIGWDAYVTCNNCDYTTYKEIPENGHSYEGNLCSACSHKKVDIQIVDVALRPSCAGLYFKGSFTFAEEVTVGCYGIAVSLYNYLPVADGSDFSSIATEGYSSVLIANILSGEGTNGATLIYARPYAQLDDDTYVYGDVIVVNLNMVVEMVDFHWETLTDVQKTALADMYRKYTDAMKNWQIPKIKAFA